MIRALLALDLRRATRRLGRRREATAVSSLALAGVGAALVIVGRTAAPDLASAGGLTALGFVVGVPIAYLAYRTLYGSPDRVLLRTLGLPGGAQLGARAVRLGAIAAAVAALAALPYLLRPEGPSVLAAAAFAAAWAWALSAAFTAGAARTVARGAARWSRAGLGWDPELAKVAPLLYAPLPAAFAAAGVGMATWIDPLAVAVATAVVVPLSWIYARRAAGAAYGGFHPHAVEISFVPPAPMEAAFRARGGMARFLSPRAAAVWRRNALLQTRHQPWVRRMAWIVVLGSLVAIGRWGAELEVRAVVSALVGAALVLKTAACVGVMLRDRPESARFDRGLGVLRADAWIGSIAFVFGALAWVAVPVGIIWWIWTPLGGEAWFAAAVVLSIVGGIIGASAGERRE